MHEQFKFRDEDSFLEKVQSLSLDIPFSEDIGILFEPVKAGPLRLPNRLAVHPLEGADAGPDGDPSELTFRRYRRFAGGGCGLIWFEATAVRPDGRSNPRQLVLAGKNLPAWRSLVSETRRFAHESAGSEHRPALILQLTHSGRFSKPAGSRTPVIAQHNSSLDELVSIGPDWPVIEDGELDSLAEDFLAAARLAAEAGFDGVDVKACHGYLVAELLASFGRQNGRYGGSFENRTRFLRDVWSRIKSELKDKVVTTRLNVYDGLSRPFGFGTSPADTEKEDLAEPAALMKILSDEGAALLSISAGIPALDPHIGRPFDKPLKGAALPDEHPLTGVARLIRITGELQNKFPYLPLLSAGYSWLRQFMPPVAAGAVKERRVTLVGLGRGALAYPDWARDLAEKGRLDPRRVCTACSRCSGLLRDGRPVGCVVQDREVYE